MRSGPLVPSCAAPLRGWLRCSLVAAAALSAQAPGQEDINLVQDPGFDRLAPPATAPWEIRYGQKMSELTAKPRWEVVAAPGSARDADGQHLHLRQGEPSAGTVYIGQRIRLPDPLPPLGLAVSYQTFCAMENRSGALSFLLLTPPVWEQLSANPEEPATPVEGDVFQAEFHRNAEDVTGWRRATAPEDALAKALEGRAGQDVVVAVAWSTWHPTQNEWLRLDDLHLGSPEPYVRPDSWPRYAMAAEPLTLRVRAHGGPGAEVLLRVRSAGQTGTEPWLEMAMASAAPDAFQAQIPGELLQHPVAVEAVLRQPGRADLGTATARIALSQRPSHPSIWYTPAELDRMRGKVALHDWAAEVWQSIKTAADEALKQTAAVPPTLGGGWSHDYTCPADGSRLQFREDQPHAHLCPKCGKEWSDEKRDAVWRATVHGRFVTRAERCALAYQIGGDPAHAREAIRILLWYADHYAGFPLGKGPAGQGRIMSQSLSEASLLTSIVNAADLAYPAMSVDEARRIEQDLVRAAAYHVAAYRDRFRIHNIACWHNAAMACAGYFLGDPELVERANEGRYGFRHQVAEGILADGMWYERSLGYHGYTLTALIRHAEAARHAGHDLHLLPPLRGMFTLPLRLSFPNLVPPAFNDMGYASGRVAASPLEVGLAWYGDPEIASALRELYRLGASRASEYAWHFGEELPEAGPYVPPPSVDLSATGIAVLRRGSGSETLCAMLEYGEHGGGHGHPDKLQLLFYGAGRILAPDMGTVGYGNSMHARWFKTTPSHNTVTIGGANMRGVAGRLDGFEANERFAAVTASADTVYPGWTLTRRLLLADGFLVDDFLVGGDAEQTIDWFLRAPGELILSMPLEPLEETPLSPPYAYMEGLEGGEGAGVWTAEWRQEEGAQAPRLHLTMCGAPGTQVARAMAPAPRGERWHNLRVRRQGAATRFTAVLQVVGRDAQALPVRFDATGVQVGEHHVGYPPEPTGLLTVE